MKKSRFKLLALVVIIFLCVGSFLAFAQEHPQSADLEGSVKAGDTGAPAGDNSLIYIAAALAVGLSSLGAAWAVSSVGSAAMGAISEKPELSGRALIYVGLAEGIAIYGLIVAIMILGKV